MKTTEVSVRVNFSKLLLDKHGLLQRNNPFISGLSSVEYILATGGTFRDLQHYASDIATECEGELKNFAIAEASRFCHIAITASQWT